jgi:exopolysaccharide biosynthesis protein
MKKYIFLVALFIFFPLSSLKADSLGERLSGRILIDVENNGEAWYVYPKNSKRYYLGRPKDAFSVMRELGLGISERDFGRIAQADTEVEGDLEFAKRLSGLIVLQVERNGEAWYINPLTYKKHYLGRPSDAFSIMRSLGLGISRKNLAYVHKNTLNESINAYSSYKYKEVANYENEEYLADVVEINLNNPNLKIITDTTNSQDCVGRCQAKELVDYTNSSNAFAAINGSYFDTSSDKLNYYFFPVYNSRLDVFINEDQLKYPTTGPLIVFDENNRFYYFKDSRDFGSVYQFEEKYGVKIQAAIGNKPRLVEEGKNLLIDWEVDENQRNIKTNRSAIGYKKEAYGKGRIYLIVVRDVTISDLAEIVKGMGMEYAINLDGGHSTALFYNGEYMFGPGRDIPNAILFSEK